MGEITLPPNLTAIGGSPSRMHVLERDHAAAQPHRLWTGPPSPRSRSEITLPPNLAEIGNGTFYQCTSVSEITLPPNFTEIEQESLPQLHVAGRGRAAAQPHRGQNARLPQVLVLERRHTAGRSTSGQLPSMVALGRHGYPWHSCCDRGASVAASMAVAAPRQRAVRLVQGHVHLIQGQQPTTDSVAVRGRFHWFTSVTMAAPDNHTQWLKRSPCVDRGQLLRCCVWCTFRSAFQSPQNHDSGQPHGRWHEPQGLSDYRLCAVAKAPAGSRRPARALAGRPICTCSIATAESFSE